MAKQVVTEVRNGESVKITLSYEFEPFLIGKKERQEVVQGNVTKYWVRVPDDIVGVRVNTYERKIERMELKARKRQEILKALEIKKRERMNRYREMIDEGKEIVPTEKDYQSARKLQGISLRAQNKKLCKV